MSVYHSIIRPVTSEFCDLGEPWRKTGLKKRLRLFAKASRFKICFLLVQPKKISGHKLRLYPSVMFGAEKEKGYNNDSCVHLLAITVPDTMLST